ncbi:hypothetical protein [Paraburkholderia sp. JPY419]|uniref:hypothetical protein n=1 Tax=Paraburkholderia sp. JPY419 TaxID=667660 RepID=UPI003D1F0568
MNKPLFLLACLSPMFLLTACPGGTQDVQKLVNQCAQNDLDSTHMIYFGPSNNVGPGSIWTDNTNGSGYHIRFTLTDMPMPQSFLNSGNPFQCSGTNTMTLTSNADISAAISALPLSAEASNAFKRATSVTVSLTSASWDDVKEGPYEAYINALAATSPVRQDIDTGKRLVMIRALRVSGFSEKLTFDTNDAPSLQAKYTGPLPSGTTGNVGATLSGSWDNAQNLTITSAGDFYVEGELSGYTTTGLAAAGTSPFANPGGISIDPKARVVVDKAPS